MGSGGGGGSTPKLLDDNLKSKQFLRVLDLISEGPIYGPVDQSHLSSFMLNKTPVTDSSGNATINGVSVAWRPGTATQTPINGFNTIEATTVVNTDVTQATPLVRTVTDTDVDRIRMNIGVSSLVQQDTKGNQKETSVTMVIETRVGNGAWQVQKTVTITGKQSGEYLEAHLFDAPETKPFDIRLRRVTPDSNSDLLNNGTIWNSYTEITDDNLSYPYAAVAGCVVDRDQYTDTPTRTYHLRGLIVDVPDNYDPIARTYSGIWTGGFKSAWTNNPAWLFRALVKNTRYGLAKRAGYIDVDDGSLYVLSQFCDQLVDDGYGGKEPRFTLNAYITEQKSARDLLDDIAGMFRGIALWDGMRFSVMLDNPQDPVASITNANVVDGLFSYSSMKRSERFNAVIVSWTDPNNGWSQVKEYVSDDEMIDRYGYNETTLEAFGCTSRGQAFRTGKWMLETCKRETKKITFKMAREAIRFMPGDVVEVMDNNYAASRLGGRIMSHAGRSITVDADVSELVGGGDSMSLMGSNGKFVKYEISSVASRVITLKSTPSWVRDGTVFVITTGEVAPRLFRIMGISEDENNSVYSISATLHDPNKQAVVDDGAVFETPNDTLNGYRVPNIENLRIINVNSETVQVTAAWETATLTKKIVFELYVYSLDGKVVAQYETDQFRYDFYGLDAGSYTLGVRGRNENGMKGAETQVSLVIGAPSAPTFIQWTPGIFSADIVPVMNVTATTDTSFEFWYTGEVPASSISAVEDEAQFLGRASQWTLHGLKADTTYYMYVRTKNAFGVSQFVESSGKASFDIPGMIDLIDEAIRDSEAFENLTGKIDTNIEGILQNALDNNSTVDHQFAINGEVRADIIIIKTTVATVSEAMAQLETQVQAQIGDLSAAVNEKLTATVTDNGTAKASYTLRVGINRSGVYYGAGMAIGIEPSGSSYKSTIAFNADQFGIYTGSDAGSYQLAFAAVNGQVFIRSAFIQDGSIDNAKIGNFIQSSNYVAGTTGWRLDKASNTLELNSTASGQGRSKVNNFGMAVYDANGVARFKAGDLSNL
ncbi:phage tail protein [Pantoea dispersa]|uniref:host specificity protein J n=1 Tax=Pantoea dispersa TaxID=59814 RepID=UPI0032ED5DDA